MHGYTPNALALPLALTAAIVVASGLTIALRERFTHLGRLHLVLTVAVAGFQACMAGAMLAQQESLVLHWMQYATFCALLIAPLAYLLSSTLTGQRRAQRRGLAGVWAATGVLAVCQWDPLESTCRHASLSIL